MTRLSSLLLTLTILLCTGSAFAQIDSIPSPPSPPPVPVPENEINIRVGGDRGGVNIETRDSVTGAVMDTTRLKMGNKTVIIIDNKNENSTDSTDVDAKTPKEVSRSKRHELNHWDGIDMGFNGFINADQGYGPLDGDDYMELDQWGSRYIAFNFGETKLRLIKDYVGIYTGLGVQANSYKFKKDNSFAFSRDTVIAFQDSTIRDYRKNKFRTMWVTVPLMLEFNTSNSASNNFFLAAGVVGGYNIGNMYKQKIKRTTVVDGESEDQREKNTFKGGFNVADLKLDAAVRVGYKSMALTASYQLTELFDEGTGPELYPATLALSFYFD